MDRCWITSSRNYKGSISPLMSHCRNTHHPSPKFTYLLIVDLNDTVSIRIKSLEGERETTDGRTRLDKVIERNIAAT